MTETTAVASLAEIMRHLASEFDAFMPEPSSFTIYTYDHRSPIVVLTFDVEGAACVETWAAKYGSTHVTRQPFAKGTKWLTTDGFQLMGMSVQLNGYDPREEEPVDLPAVAADAQTIVAESVDHDAWENDFANCPRCGNPRANGWTTHCDTCDGEQQAVQP